MALIKVTGEIVFNDNYTQKEIDNNFPSSIGGNAGDISGLSIEGTEFSCYLYTNIDATKMVHKKEMALYQDITAEILSNYDDNVSKMIQSIENINSIS